MTLTYRELLLIIPAVLGESFMVWALWNFLRASGRR
jgi:hypothetical protein